MRPRARLTLLLGALGACAPQPQAGTDRAPTDLKRAAAQFYEVYGRDLSAHARERLAGYYHPDGAVIVFAGQRFARSRADLDSRYRTEWQGPAFFAWDSLVFDSLSPTQVLVTGGFRWLRPGTADTGRYIYAALLEAVDSGLAIRLEHETPAPPRPGASR